MAKKRKEEENNLRVMEEGENLPFEKVLVVGVGEDMVGVASPKAQRSGEGTTHHTSPPGPLQQHQRWPRALNTSPLQVSPPTSL